MQRRRRALAGGAPAGCSLPAGAYFNETYDTGSGTNNGFDSTNPCGSAPCLDDTTTGGSQYEDPDLDVSSYTGSACFDGEGLRSHGDNASPFQTAELTATISSTSDLYFYTDFYFSDLPAAGSDLIVFKTGGTTRALLRFTTSGNVALYVGGVPRWTSTATLSTSTEYTIEIFVSTTVSCEVWLGGDASEDSGSIAWSIGGNIDTVKWGTPATAQDAGNDRNWDFDNTIIHSSRIGS